MDSNLLAILFLWGIVVGILENYVIAPLVERVKSRPAKVFIVVLAIAGVLCGVFMSLQTVTDKAQYTIINAKTTNGDALELTIEDEDGQPATVFVGIDDMITEQRDDDCLVVLKYLTGEKRFVVKCSKQSEFLQIYESYRLQQQLLT